MKFNEHPDLTGKHAFLGASKNAWLNYNDQKLADSFVNSYANEIGTRVHSLAASLIARKKKLHKYDHLTIEMALLDAKIPEPFIDANYILKNLIPYVNDAIDYNMQPEVTLYYSDVAFGTTDAIQYYEDQKLLRIHDLKTGTTPAHMEQLQIYAAYFFLEYGDILGISPKDVTTKLCIYQTADVLELEPNPEDTLDIMHKAEHDTEVLNRVRRGAKV